MKTYLERYKAIDAQLAELRYHIFPRVVEVAKALHKDYPDDAADLQHINADGAYYTWQEWKWGSKQDHSLLVPLNYLENDNWRDLVQQELDEKDRLMMERVRQCADEGVAKQIAERDRLLALHPLK